MRLPILLFAVVAAVIVAAWAWMGRPVPMPPSPIASGEKLYCVSYSPFRAGQSPLDQTTRITSQQIEEDLTNLARVTDCVRTYSIELGLDQVTPIAGKLGLKVLQGLWLSRDKDRNQREIDAVVELANQHKDVVRAVIVGNEVLLRGEMSGSDLAAVIREVKSRVPVRVTYADVWEFWLRHPGVYEAADFVTIHILPYWEDFPIAAAQAGAHVDQIRKHVVEAYPGKEVLIGEAGWPSHGRMREGALPSPSSQARMLHDVLNVAKAGGFNVNLFEAFDEPWKRALEGTVGGYWGLYDTHTRAPKFTWGQPVSDHPQWKALAAAGVALAALIFVLAYWTRGVAGLPGATWSALACVAAGSGFLIGLSIEKAMVESVGAVGWVRSGVLCLLAVAAPLIGAVTIARGTRIASFAELLRGSPRRERDGLSLAAGAALMALSVVAVQLLLGLMFDPRYRDLPFAALASAAIPFGVLAIRSGSAWRAEGHAERATAAVLVISAVYVAFNEGFSNWQAQGTAAAALVLAATLLRLVGVRRTK